MKISNYILWITILFVAGISSCKEDEPALYNAVNGIYFNNRASDNSLLDSTSYTFVYNEEDTASIRIIVQSVGEQSSEDRPVAIQVTSEDAVEGTDYILPEKCVLPANQSQFEYVIILKRTAVLQEEVKTLHFKISANDYFELPVTQEVVDATNNIATSMIDFKIEFSDMYTTPPAAWVDETICGKFSPKKLDLINQVLGIPKADFNDPSIITLAKFNFINATMGAHVLEVVMNAEMTGEPIGDEYFDEDGNLLFEEYMYM